MKISVVMAVYCGEKFIAGQLTSLFAQTLPPSEIVICDDSPDDRTYKCIRAFEEKHPGVIRYVKNPVALGVSANFEKALSLASGDIIFLADQDDVWLPEKMEKLAAALDQEHQGAFCDSILTDENLVPTGRTHRDTRNFSRRERKKIVHGTAEEFENAALKRFPGAGHNMAFSAALKEKLLPFPALPECHDSWIGYTVMLHSRWAVVDEPLTLFRQHGENTSKAGQYSALGHARLSVSRNAARWYGELFAELLKRAGNISIPGKYIQRQIFSAQRGNLPEMGFVKRVFFAVRQLFNGNYFRFGRGILSAVQDVFFTAKL